MVTCLFVLPQEPFFLLLGQEAHQDFEVVLWEVLLLTIREIHQLSKGLLNCFILLLVDKEKFDFHLNVLV